MSRDNLKTTLQSTERTGEKPIKVRLEITAHFSPDAGFEGNTIIFRCQPEGGNVTRSKLAVTFDDWGKVAQIRDFLAECFASDVIESQALTLDIRDGVASITPHSRSPNRQEDVSEVTIRVDQERISFFSAGSLHPYIYTYEEKDGSGRRDRKTAKKLLDFLDKILALHPNYSIEGGDSDVISSFPLLNPQRVQRSLTEIVSEDAELYRAYQKAVSEFEQGEHGDSIRDLGRAAEIIIDVVTAELYASDSLPDNMSGRLNKLDKTESGVAAFIGKSLSGLWWLRNKVSHANGYEATEMDAFYALICFQIAVEKLFTDFFDWEV